MIVFVIGGRFFRWKDAEDAEIAALIELSEADKLLLICEYMDIVKIPVCFRELKKITLLLLSVN